MDTVPPNPSLQPAPLGQLNCTWEDDVTVTHIWADTLNAMGAQRSHLPVNANHRHTTFYLPKPSSQASGISLPNTLILLKVGQGTYHVLQHQARAEKWDLCVLLVDGEDRGIVIIMLCTLTYTTTMFLNTNMHHADHPQPQFTKHQAWGHQSYFCQSNHSTQCDGLASCLEDACSI